MKTPTVVVVAAWMTVIGTVIGGIHLLLAIKRSA